MRISLLPGESQSLWQRSFLGLKPRHWASEGDFWVQQFTSLLTLYLAKQQDSGPPCSEGDPFTHGPILLGTYQQVALFKCHLNSTLLQNPIIIQLFSFYWQEVPSTVPRVCVLPHSRGNKRDLLDDSFVPDCPWLIWLWHNLQKATLSMTEFRCQQSLMQ